MKLKRGLLYISLWNRLNKNIGVGNIITRKEFFCILGKHFLIPKNVRDLVIKEMEELDLIKRENKNEIKILKCEIDIEKDANTLYKKAGLFCFI